jgi:hypothetical protein
MYKICSSYKHLNDRDFYNINGINLHRKSLYRVIFEDQIPDPTEKGLFPTGSESGPATSF